MKVTKKLINDDDMEKDRMEIKPVSAPIGFTPQAWMQEVERFFTNLYKHGEASAEDYADGWGPGCEDMTLCELKRVLKMIKPDKAHGRWRTPGRALKLIMKDQVIMQKTVSAMNHRLHLRQEDNDGALREPAMGALLPKKVAPVDAGGFRLIGISDGLEKCYAMILTNR